MDNLSNGNEPNIGLHSEENQLVPLADIIRDIKSTVVESTENPDPDTAEKLRQEAVIALRNLAIELSRNDLL